MEKEFIVPLDKSKSIFEQLMHERKKLKKIDEELDKTVTEICIRIREIILCNRKNNTSHPTGVDELNALSSNIEAIKGYRSILFSLKNPVSRDTNGIQH